MIVVRDASMSDIPDIARLYVQGVNEGHVGPCAFEVVCHKDRHHLSNEYILETHIKAFKERIEYKRGTLYKSEKDILYTILVVTKDKKVVAFLETQAANKARHNSKPLSKKDNDIEIWSLFVDRNERGKGIGRLLLKRQIKKRDENTNTENRYNIFIRLLPASQVMKGIVKKYGFKISGNPSPEGIQAYVI